jgi:predicted protein tyrosine phosphatase
MRILFVCSRNRRRSPTAEIVCSTWPGVEAVSAGTAPDAVTSLCEDLIQWAEVIFVMENHHRDTMRRRFGTLLASKRLVVLRVPDRYKYMDPQLIQMFRDRVPRHLPQQRAPKESDTVV